MKWIYFILAVLFFIYFFKSINTSILIIRANNINNYPKIVNILLVWVLPFYWDSRVRNEIEKDREIDIEQMGFPNEMYFDDDL
jgi:hypothetical protein